MFLKNYFNQCKKENEIPPEKYNFAQNGLTIIRFKLKSMLCRNPILCQNSGHPLGDFKATCLYWLFRTSFSSCESNEYPKKTLPADFAQAPQCILGYKVRVKRSDAIAIYLIWGHIQTTLTIYICLLTSTHQAPQSWGVCLVSWLSSLRQFKIRIHQHKI